MLLLFEAMAKDQRTQIQSLIVCPFVLTLKAMKSKESHIYFKQHRHHQGTPPRTIEGVHYDE